MFLACSGEQMWRSSGLWQKCLLQHMNVHDLRQRITVWKIFEVAGFPFSDTWRGTRMVLNLIKCPFVILSFWVFSPNLFVYFKYLLTQYRSVVVWSSIGSFHYLNLSGEDFPAEGSMSPLPGCSYGTLFIVCFLIGISSSPICLSILGTT